MNPIKTRLAGALQMLELGGANLLAAEIEALGQSVLTQKIEANVPILEALIRGIVLLQGYLKYLETGKKDHPLSVLAAVNELRIARGEPPRIPVDLFEPDLTAPLPPTLSTAARAIEDTELRSIAARLRLQYEAALLYWFRDPGGEGLPRLTQVITELRQCAHRAATRRLWWLAQGVTEALQERGLRDSQEIKLLLGSLDKYIKTLAQEGESALAAGVPETLLKSLLFHIANATSSGTEVTAIKATYHLEYYLPADQALPSALGMETIEAVLTSLGEELDHAKDLLDMLERTPQQSQQNQAALWNVLHKLTDTLEILGLNEPIALLRKPLGRLEHPIQKEATLGKEQRRELACALLQMESL
jgi:chemosensory pili system protein ChpA (sensor histidine kinase/response regulator)